MNPDGTEQTEIIPGDNKFTYRGASISPNGKKVIFEKQKILSTKQYVSKDQRGVTETSSATYLMPDIWACNIDGTDQTQITTNPLSDQEATWLDDQTIVFSSDRPQSGKYEDKKWDLWKAKFSF